MQPRILIVDDQRYIAGWLAFHFSANGYSVTVADSGAEALEIAAVRTFDAALIDWQMPEVDGIAVARVLLGRAAVRREPMAAWLMTGADPLHAAQPASDAGCRGVFSKPLKIVELLKTIQIYLESAPPATVKNGAIKNPGANSRRGSRCWPCSD